MEELLDSDSLHHDSCLKSSLDVIWVFGQINSLLLESVFDNVNVGS